MILSVECDSVSKFKFQIHQINFIPIEQIRPIKSDSENFGRRTYQFSIPKEADGGIPQPKMKRVLSSFSLSKKAASSATANTEEQIPPKVEVDARLPDPAILTSNQPMPLRLLVRRMDNGSLPLYLQTLQVELVGHTRIRAGAVVRSDPSSWVVTSRSNMNQYLEFPEPERTAQVNGTDSKNGPETSNIPPSAADRKASEAMGNAPLLDRATLDEKPTSKEKETLHSREIVLDSTSWERPIPETVAPTFKTCNIERTYDLEVRIGIGFGAQSMKNQIILPLRLGCEVWSGIPPPKSLIAAMESRQGQAATKPVTKKPLSAEAAANVASYQAQSQAEASATALHDDAPPTYEEALATDIQPVDGPRNYRPPPAPDAGDGFARDRHEKRRDS